MPFECPQDVANDYERLLNTNEEYDVIIYAGGNNREIYAHSLVLRTRSQHFRSVLSTKSLEKKDGKIIIKIPDITFQFFNMILRFIYCGKVDLDQLHGPDILKLLKAVHRLNIQILTNYIQEYLIKNKNDYVQQNSIEILEEVYPNNAFTVLQNACIKKICKDPESLLNSNKFTNLKAPLLELIFKRDDLSLNEIVIWDNLIRWCLTQHPNISQDPTHWNNDETTIMERTIHRFIPLIRFRHITQENFTTKVFPFKDIMPKDLFNNIKDDRPSRLPKYNINSVLINQNHIEVFANWIYRKDKFYGRIPYEFDLLYRASRDGNTSEAFHAKCDNKGPTIVVVKVSNSNQIVGGYNPLKWDTSGWKTTHDSFIFSFSDRNNLQSAKVSYSCGDTHSVGCHSDKGPTFGWDLNVYKGIWYSGFWYFAMSKSYANIGIPGKFIADDYEVFKVIKK